MLDRPLARYGAAAAALVTGRLKRWWLRLVGGPQPDGGHASTARHVAAGDSHKTDTPPAKRPAGPGELSLAEDRLPKPKARSGRAGFDPYSSDAGYSKPRGWDRVDHD
jgi:hypothetical protein